MTLNPAQLAHADRLIVNRTEILGQLVEMYREGIARGLPPAIATGAIGVLCRDRFSPEELDSLVAVAVVRLAERPVS